MAIIDQFLKPVSMWEGIKRMEVRVEMGKGKSYVFSTTFQISIVIFFMLQSPRVIPTGGNSANSCWQAGFSIFNHQSLCKTRDELCGNRTPQHGNISKEIKKSHGFSGLSELHQGHQLAVVYQLCELSSNVSQSTAIRSQQRPIPSANPSNSTNLAGRITHKRREDCPSPSRPSTKT